MFAIICNSLASNKRSVTWDFTNDTTYPIAIKSCTQSVVIYRGTVQTHGTVFSVDVGKKLPPIYVFYYDNTGFEIWSFTISCEIGGNARISCCNDGGFYGDRLCDDIDPYSGFAVSLSRLTNNTLFDQPDL